MRNASFAEILIDKILGQEPPVSLPERDLSPAHLSYLLGTIGQSRFDIGLKATAYRRHIKPPQPRKSHNLTCSQAAALGLLNREGADLDSGFNLKELKLAFRRLALKSHPDLGGRTDAFIAIRHSYDILLAVFKK